MLTRRSFLRIIASMFGSVVASACARAMPTPAPPSPSLPIATPPITTLTPTVESSPTAPVVATATPTPSGPDFARVRGDQFYYRGARFPINGFNYYPRLHPWRTFNIGEWEPRAVEYELRLGAGLGANTVRMFIDYQFSLDNTKAQQPRDAYFAPIPRYIANVREFLDIAGRLDLKVIVTLFDSLDWFIYQPQNHWMAEEYLKELIPPFVNDPRVLCWDLQNEPDRAIRLVGSDSVIPFFKRIAAQIRQMDSNHLQTIGWIDRARAKYFADLDDSLDFWCFHFYDAADQLNDLVQFYKTKTTKPVLLEEFGLATGGPGPNGQHSELDQAVHYNIVLTILEANQMCGSVFWILTDFPVGLAGNPPLLNDSPENHFGIFRLDYSEKPAAAEIRSFWRPRRPAFKIAP
jgi:endo-1,4-beta-mannosidase